MSRSEGLALNKKHYILKATGNLVCRQDFFIRDTVKFCLCPTLGNAEESPYSYLSLIFQPIFNGASHPYIHYLKQCNKVTHSNGLQDMLYCKRISKHCISEHRDDHATGSKTACPLSQNVAYFATMSLKAIITQEFRFYYKKWTDIFMGRCHKPDSHNG